MASTPESESNAAAEVDSFSAPSIISELFSSPVNWLITVIIAALVYRLYKSKYGTGAVKAPAPELPRLRKDMTAAELRKYDGTQPDGRVLVAVNGWIFDATKGRRFYGPGGQYGAFGGRDASRGLATFSVMASDKEYDDLSDLNSMEMESVKEWEAQFREKYELVGRFLKPGEEATNYSDEELEDTDNSTSATDKKED